MNFLDKNYPDMSQSMADNDISAIRGSPEKLTTNNFITTPSMSQTPRVHDFDNSFYGKS